MSVTDLPAVNATLNGIAAVLLVVGWVLIRRRQFDAHRRVMLAALATSALFLASYVTYHANVGSRPFPGQGAVRALYFAILIPHVILAAAIVPMALITVSRTVIEFDEDVDWFADGEVYSPARRFDLKVENRALKIRGARS